MIKRLHFPLLVKNPHLIYLDNGATTQKPDVMMSSLTSYYTNANSNVGRGNYDLAMESEKYLNESRDYIANFFGTSSSNLIFTSSATDSLNQAAYMASQFLKEKDVIILTIWDHHANILPWQRLAKEKNIKIKFIDSIEDMYNPLNLNDEFWDNVKLVSMPHVSNTTGNIFPVKKWIDIAKKRNIITVVDGSQAVSSFKINIQDIGADFYAFSSHKLYGPMGLGCLFVENKKFMDTTPMILGGGIIEDVFTTHYTLKDTIEKFEAGTPNVANIYSFAQTLSWLSENNWNYNLEKIKKYNLVLIDFANDCSNIKLLTDIRYPHIATTTMNFPSIHSHDLGTFLSDKLIAVRVGKHCAYPLHRFMGEKHSVRFSLGIYNTQEEIDFSIKSLKEAIEFFK